MKRIEIAPLLHALSSLLVIALSYWAEPRLIISRGTARTLGTMIFILGMTLFAWAIVHLRLAFLGEIQPVSDRLVTSGPYRFVRHPLYLSMTLALLGIAVLFRGACGLMGTLCFFLPTAWYRATLEERALSERFGADWDHYAARTSFMLPGL